MAEHILVDLVAPGGTLLVVHHSVEGEHLDEAFDPALYVLPADVAALLDAQWRIEVDERRPRSISGGSGAHHVHDLVLRARRR